MIHTISPSIARSEMFRLGRDFGRKPSGFLGKLSGVSQVPRSIDLPATFVRALILGGKGSRKRDLVQKLHRLPYSNDLIELRHPSTSCSVSKVTRHGHGSTKDEETLVHVILTEVPALDLASDIEKENLRDKMAILLGQERTSGKRPYDLCVLAFDTNDIQSWHCAKELEHQILTDEMPRLFVGTTSRGDSPNKAPMREAYEHCKLMELEPPLIVSLGEVTESDSSALEHLVGCAQDELQVVVSFRSTPHGERKRRAAARRRKALWIGGLVTAGITVVLGLSSLAGKRRTGERGWLSFFQFSPIILCS